MKKLSYLLMIVAIMIPFMVLNAQSPSQKSANSPVVEVLYFHGPQRCKTCVALENAAKEVVNTRFANDVKSSKVKFKEIDLSTKEGEKIGDKYEVAWSSLIIVRKDGKKEKIANLTDDGFRYAVNNKVKIQGLIADKIKEFLK